LVKLFFVVFSSVIGKPLSMGGNTKPPMLGKAWTATWDIGC